MIFLSHNTKDKHTVEPIFLKLFEKYGDILFYDSWSIQPGESIIGGMDSGLSKENIFLLFWSKNASQSNAVKVEWQSAFSKNVLYGEGKFQVVRLDREPLPQILSDLKYIDYYQEGESSTYDMICRIIEGKNVFTPKHKKNINLGVSTKKISKFHFQYIVEALTHVEYDLIFGIYTDTLNADLNLFSMTIPGSFMIHNYERSPIIIKGKDPILNSRLISDRSIIQPGIAKIIDIKVDERIFSKANIENISLNFLILNQKGESLDYR